MRQRDRDRNRNRNDRDEREAEAEAETERAKDSRGIDRVIAIHINSLSVHELRESECFELSGFDTLRLEPLSKSRDHFLMKENSRVDNLRVMKFLEKESRQ